MTKPKLRPSGSDEWDEYFALLLFDRVPIAEWDTHGPWVSLKDCTPSMAKRIIANLLDIICANSGSILPSRLADEAIAFLAPSPARNSIQDGEAAFKAAEYQANHPNSSLRERAMAAGVNHITIQKWQANKYYQFTLFHFVSERAGARHISSILSVLVRLLRRLDCLNRTITII